VHFAQKNCGCGKGKKKKKKREKYVSQPGPRDWNKKITGGDYSGKGTKFLTKEERHLGLLMLQEKERGVRSQASFCGVSLHTKND